MKRAYFLFALEGGGRRCNGGLQQKLLSKGALYSHYISYSIICIILPIRFHKSLTMDIILSTAFGVKSNCQTDPDDPIMAKGKAAASQTPFKKLVMGLLFLVPFSKTIMYLMSRWLFSTFFDLGHVAQEVIDLRKTDPSTKRMVNVYMNAMCVLSYAPAPRKKISWLS